MKKRILLLVLLIALTFSLGEAQKVDYSFDSPQKPWVNQRTENADFAYHHPSLNAGMILSSRCEQKASEPTLEVLFRHLFIDFDNKTITNQMKELLDGKESLVTELEADYGGERFRFLSVIAKRKACVYDLLLIAPPNNFDEAKGDFEKIVKSFKFK